MTEDIGIRITAEYNGQQLNDANADIRQFEQSLTEMAQASQHAQQDLVETATNLNDVAEAAQYAASEVEDYYGQAAGMPPPPDDFWPEEFEQTAETANKANEALREMDQRLQETQTESQELAQTTEELGDEEKTLGQRLEATYQAFKDAKSESIALKSQFKSLGKDMPLEELDKLSQQIGEAEHTEYELIVQNRILMKEMRDMGENAEFSNRTLSILNRELNQSEKYITGLGNAEREAIKQAQGFQDAVHGVGDQVGVVGSKIDDMADRITSWAEHAKTGIASAVSYKAMQLIEDGFRAAEQFIRDADKELVQFDSDLRQVFTLAPQLSAGMRRQLSADTLAIGADIGRLTDETLPAMYQALSLGLPEENALNAVAIASDAARAGNAELQETMVLGQSIINAYGADMYDLTQVYDLLFFAIKNGAVTMPELLQGMNDITSVAGEANVRLEDVVSSIIVMTKQGDSFNEAAGLMSNMLTQLQIEGTALGGAFKNAAGVGFREFIAEGGTLAEALELVQQHAQDTGQSLVEMVGGDSPFYRDQQAMRGTLELTGKHLQEFQDTTAEAQITQGLMAEASNEVADSLEVQQAKTEASTERLKVLVAEGLRPSKEAWLEFKAAVAEGLGDTVASGNEARSLREEMEALGLSAQNMREVEAAVFAGGGDLNVQLQRNTAALALLAEGYDLTTLNAGQFAYAIDQVIQTQDQETAAHERALAAYQNQAHGLDRLYAAQNRNREVQFDLADLYATSAQSAQGYANELGNMGAEAANTYEVLKVLDGDTIRIKMESEIKDVRFLNINTPEIDHGEGAMPGAYEAMAVTQAYFDTHPFQLTTALSRESYDRIIAAIPELEEQLVEEGWALPLPVHMTEDPEMAAHLEELAYHAALAGQGIFNDQALRMSYLRGEVSDINVYYEELIASQKALIPAFKEAAGPVGDLYEAMSSLDSLPDWDAGGIQEAEADIAAAKEGIVQSLGDIAYEQYVAQNGMNETAIAFGVQAGLFTQAEGDARLEFANTSLAIQDLIANQYQLGLTDAELLEATRLLQEGLATTPEKAIAVARGVDVLSTSLSGAHTDALNTKEALLALEGDYSASFTTHYTNVYTDVYQGAADSSGYDPNAQGHENARGTGGPVNPYTAYLVGDDNGRLTPYSELFVPNTSGTILNPQETAALLNGNGSQAPGGVTIHIEVNNIITPLPGDDLAETVADSTHDAAESGLLAAARQIGLQI